MGIRSSKFGVLELADRCCTALYHPVYLCQNHKVLGIYVCGCSVQVFGQSIS